MIFNLYFFIFIFIFIFYYFLLIYLGKKDKDINIFNKLESLRISNFYFEFFIALIYLFLNFLIFIFLRIFYLKSKESYQFFQSLEINNIFKIIFLLFSLILYFKILEKLFYFRIIKIHIFLSKYKKYNTFSEKIQKIECWISWKFGDICHFFYKYCIDEESMINSIKMDFLIRNARENIIRKTEDIVYFDNV